MLIEPEHNLIVTVIWLARGEHTPFSVEKCLNCVALGRLLDC